MILLIHVGATMLLFTSWWCFRDVVGEQPPMFQALEVSFRTDKTNLWRPPPVPPTTRHPHPRCPHILLWLYVFTTAQIPTLGAVPPSLCATLGTLFVVTTNF